ERGERLRFTLEPREAIGVLCKCVGQHLQGDVAPQIHVPGAIHLAHPAHADLCGDLVRTDATTGGQWHPRINNALTIAFFGPSALRSRPGPARGSCLRSRECSARDASAPLRPLA